MSGSDIRLAYIGAGAVVERSHLPALSQCEGFEVTTLVDSNQAQLDKLKARYGIRHACSNYLEALDKFDVAVIATPSVSHYEIAMALLQAGKHLLIEKPLATSSAQAQALVDYARQHGNVLAVSLVRRFQPHFRLFKALLENALVGTPDTFQIEEGGIFNWPVQSTVFYRRDIFGGGVLMDHGSHLLDACLWWFGDYTEVEYQDDARGGVEADCQLELTLRSGARGTIIMSRIRTLLNRVRVSGDRGTLTMNLVNGEIEFQPHGSGLSYLGRATELAHSRPPGSNIPAVTTIDLFRYQYRALRAAIDNSYQTEHHLVNAFDSLASIALIEQCYSHRQLQSSANW